MVGVVVKLSEGVGCSDDPGVGDILTDGVRVGLTETEVVILGVIDGLRVIDGVGVGVGEGQN